MNKDQKNEVIEALKEKFNQYNNFYVTNTESLTVAQITKLRRICFDKNVEMKVAKNTLIKKALESLDAEKYSGVYDSLHKVTALLFSENPKEPAMIISTFRKDANTDKPILKAAFIDGDVFEGNRNIDSPIPAVAENRANWPARGSSNDGDATGLRSAKRFEDESVAALAARSRPQYGAALFPHETRGRQSGPQTGRTRYSYRNAALESFAEPALAGAEGFQERLDSCSGGDGHRGSRH